MKTLHINVTKAVLKSYTVELEEGKPVVRATIALLTEGNKQITTYSISTQKYDYMAESNFELPLKAIQPIVDLARILEDATVAHCRDSQLALGSGVSEDPISAEDLQSLALPAEVADSDDFANPNTRDKDIIDIDDKPIDLSEIPF